MPNEVTLDANHSHLPLWKYLVGGEGAKMVTQWWESSADHPELHTLRHSRRNHKGNCCYHLLRKGEQMVIVVDTLKDVGRILRA